MIVFHRCKWLRYGHQRHEPCASERIRGSAAQSWQPADQPCEDSNGQYTTCYRPPRSMGDQQLFRAADRPCTELQTTYWIERPLLKACPLQCSTVTVGCRPHPRHSRHLDLRT